MFETPSRRPTFVRQCDSLHHRDCLPIFELQEAGVVPSRSGGDGLLQGCGYAAGSAGLAQLTTLILVLPGHPSDLGSLPVETRELQLRGRVRPPHCRRGSGRRKMENRRKMSETMKITKKRENELA